MSIIYKKEQALKNIISSNNAYRGDYLDKIGARLKKLNLSQTDHAMLIFEFQDYANHLIHTIASTEKVFVRLDKSLDMSAEEYNKVFDDID